MRRLANGLRYQNDGLLAEGQMHFMRTGKKEFSQRLTDPIKCVLVTQDWQNVDNFSSADTEIC